MFEWTFGITDREPRTWKRIEPIWDDEKITASSSDTFFHVMNHLCENAIKHRREYDYGINEHLWELRIMSPNHLSRNHETDIEALMRNDDSEDDSDDDSEDMYRGHICIQSRGSERMERFDEADYRSPDIKIDRELLPTGSVVKVTYDWGSTTTLYLKVLSVKPTIVRSLMQYFTLDLDEKRMKKEIQSVSAYSFSKEKQIDSYFPNASKAFTGNYVPIFESKNSSEDDEIIANFNKRNIGPISIGLSSWVTDTDKTFCSMEDRTASSDLLFCPSTMDPNEFFQTAEKAWKPRDPEDDPDNLSHIRYDYISRWLIPGDDEESYKRISKFHEESGSFGPKFLLFRTNQEECKQSGFDFAKVFPKTFSMLTCGKFRWFQYNKGVLRVIVGRGKGGSFRHFEAPQVLKTWKRNFESFHELLCAVEASWVYKGKDMDAETIIPPFDSDVGPLIKEPTVLASSKDVTVISKCNNKKKLVTALALSEEDGKAVLYSGHNDGTLSKWSLLDNELLWTKQVYVDASEVFPPHEYSGFYLREIAGVAGIVIRPDPSQNGQHLVYTWTHTYNGYPDCDAQQRRPSALHVWSGKNGSLVRKCICRIGECIMDDEEDDEYVSFADANPTISTVVFCQLYNERRKVYVDSIIIGLHCVCETIQDYSRSYSDFDLGEAQDFSKGNILPFYENPVDGKSALESWRGHQGIIRAMAVVDCEFLLSYSMRPGHGRPDAMILWSLRKPGVPLLRKDFWDPNRSIFHQQQVRLEDICGISVGNGEILLTDKEGNRIAVVTIKDESGCPCLDIAGYANLGQYYEGEFHGRMAMSQSHAAVIKETKADVWIFELNGNNKTHEKLDKRDGNERNFRDEEENDDAFDQNSIAEQSIAIGTVQFPSHGGDKPKTGKRKKELDDDLMIFGMQDSMVSYSGPVIAALRGNHIVVGYKNGNIARAQIISDSFKVEKESISSNHLACCSSLPSDEWFCPMLKSSEYE